ncbi:MAG: cobalamin biosynthesis protein CobQ [Mogibacterium sp.]|nr:cobalamin biosynthesis protein CobQ [Mogibacterium sp.]
MSDKMINIAWMYPDTLFLHGERGNIMALVRYAMELGLTPHVRRIDLGTEDFDPMEYDIIFYGPGEISSFRAVMEDIAGYARPIAEYIASGKVLIATGTTMSLFGEKITRFSPDAEDGRGEVIDGLCMIPAESFEREYVYGNDLDIRAEYNGYSMELIGNQIQMTDIHFSESEGYQRFGSVIYGRGNNGTDGIEGVVHNNSLFTNMLGPMLICNPWLTVRILRTAAEIKGIEVEAQDPEYKLEIKSLGLKKKFIEEKQNNQEK